MLSQKTRYALKALLELAALPAGTTLSCAQISARREIPMKFLESILHTSASQRLSLDAVPPTAGPLPVRPSTLQLRNALPLFESIDSVDDCLGRAHGLQTQLRHRR